MRHGITRRAALGVALAPCVALPSARAQEAGLGGALDASSEGVIPGGLSDQSAALARAIESAEASGRPLFLPPGRYEVAEIELPRYAHLIGVPGQSPIVFRGGVFMLRARHAGLLRLEGIVVDGDWKALDPSARGLLDADDVDDLVLSDCEFVSSPVAGAVLRACAGRVEACRFRDAGTVGLDLDQSRGMLVESNVIDGCGNTGILVERDSEGADDTIVRGNRVSGIRADSGGTGQYGNGINLDKANGVIVQGNRIDDCAFSGVRCFSSDNAEVAGNTITRSGEMALYIEFAFEGALVADNLIDDAAFEISMANFMEHGGRLAVCSGNLVRNISGVSRLPRGAPLTGAGIGAEADVAITGNTIENARYGLRLGWGEYLRDIVATGNMIRGCATGIGVSVADGAGPALIADNLISGATDGGVRGMRWEEVVTGDLAAPGAETFPHLTVEGNRVS